MIRETTNSLKELTTQEQKADIKVDNKKQGDWDSLEIQANKSKNPKETEYYWEPM